MRKHVTAITKEPTQVIDQSYEKRQKCTEQILKTQHLLYTLDVYHNTYTKVHLLKRGSNLNSLTRSRYNSNTNQKNGFMTLLSKDLRLILVQIGTTFEQMGINDVSWFFRHYNNYIEQIFRIHLQL